MSITRQRVLVLVLTFLALAVELPATLGGWQSRAWFGMRIVRAELLVRAVAPGSPAARAGIVPGDRVDVPALGIERHLDLMYPRPGERLTFDVDHAGTMRTVTLTAVPVVDDGALPWLVVGEFVSTAAFVALGTMLVYLRPSPMTWWLWGFCIGIVPVNELLEFYAFAVPRDAFASVWFAGRAFLGGFSVFPLIPFVLRFPHGRIGGWRAKTRPWMISLVAIALVYYVAIAWIGLRWGLAQYSRYNGAPALLMYLIAAVLIVATYLGAHGIDRQRLKWAVTGMLIAFAAQIAQYVPGPLLLAPAAELVSIAMPLCVAYAILRHRLIDVQFVINRALVYGGLTAFLLAFVSLLDWFTSRFISEYHLALYLEAGVTIAMGFVLDRLHAQLDRLTDRLFFRRRHRAEEHLERVARSLGFATRLESIEQAVIEEPVRWLRLASAALFRREPGETFFTRTHDAGWTDADLRTFADDASFVRYLLADNGHVLGGEIAADAVGLPQGNRAPALFVPIFCRRELQGIVMYGSHEDGTGLDPGEIALLSALGPGAGLAFDHLAYETLRAQVAALTASATPALEVP